jgi:hypothetical protein
MALYQIGRAGVPDICFHRAGSCTAPAPAPCPEAQVRDTEKATPNRQGSPVAEAAWTTSHYAAEANVGDHGKP